MYSFILVGTEVFSKEINNHSCASRTCVFDTPPVFLVFALAATENIICENFHCLTITVHEIVRSA